MSNSPGLEVRPDSADVVPTGSAQFLASVQGLVDTGVVWEVVEAGGGSISTSGLYTGPQATGTFHVRVSSRAAPSLQATATVTVTQSGSGGPGGSGSDLCAGLVQDKASHAMTAVTKPAVGQSFVDPQFGTTVRRISDAAAGGWNVIKPMYSTIQPWNADESYLILYHTDGPNAGHHLYNGKTYQHIKELNISPADLEQVYWDTTDPKKLYWFRVNTHEFYSYNVDTEVATLLHDFDTAPTSCSGTDMKSGSDPMWTDWQSRYIGLGCGSNYTKMWSYDIKNDVVGTVQTIAAGGQVLQPSPSGNLFYLDRSGNADVRNTDTSLARTMAGLAGDEHASMSKTNGVDTYISVQFDNAALEGFVATDMTTGVSRVLIGPNTGWPYPPVGQHVSGVAYKNPGWTVIGNNGQMSGSPLKLGQGVWENEIILYNLNDDSLCRIAHSRTCGGNGACGTQGYWAETHSVISPTGTRVLFGSDWVGGATVDSYVIELPSYKP